MLSPKNLRNLAALMPRGSPISAILQATACVLLGASLVASGVNAQETSPLSPTTSLFADPHKLDAQTQVYFEKNVGQWHPEALFRVQANGYQAFVTATGLTTVQTEPSSSQDLREPFTNHNTSLEPVRAWATKMTLVGGNPLPLVTTDAETGYHTNYFIGNNPLQWQTNVPTYGEVVLHQVYPGIDLVYHAGPDGGLKYDFIVHPGSSSEQIRQHFEGADVAQAPDGTLALKTGLGDINHGRPITKQADGTPVTNDYHIAEGTVSFLVGEHDLTQDLIIDPLVYSTFLGGVNDDAGSAIAVDSGGNAYLTGSTYSPAYPTTAGSYDASKNGAGDVFVTKLNSAGSGLVYSTFLGGGSVDTALGLALDSSGNAYVTGYANPGFPTTSGAYDTTHNGGADVYVTKLNPAGSGLVYSTFLGGNGTEIGRGIAVDSSGNSYVTGFTASLNYPTTAGVYDTTHNGGSDIFTTKLNTAGSALVYSTFLGGSSTDEPEDIALDGGGNAYVAGETSSSNYPTTIGAHDTTRNGGAHDAIVTKLDAAGSGLIYSTFLGSVESSEGFVLDSTGNAIVLAETFSGSYPTTSGAFDTTLNGGKDIAVTKLNSAGSGLVYSTFLGGSGNEEPRGITLDSIDNVYVVGFTESSDFPTTAGTYDSTHNGGIHDVFLTKLNSAGSSLAYSTLIGGSGDEYINADISVDASGNAYFTARTTSADFPTTAGAYDTVHNGAADAFSAKFSFPTGPPEVPVDLAASCGSPHGVHLTWNAGSGLPPASYKVYRSSDGMSFSAVGFPVTTSYTDTPTWRTTAYTYRVTATNEIGESASSSTVSLAPCDSQSPNVSGNPSVPGWTNSATLSGVSWQDAYSGLQNNIEYSLGSTSGAADLRAWTAMGTQPSVGQTSTWTPSWPLPAPSQGTQYVNMRASDRAGNLLATTDAYVLQYDTQLPSVSGNPQTVTWTNTVPSLSGISWQDSLSGLQATAQYSVGTSSGGSNVLAWTVLPVQPTPGQTTNFSPTWTPSTLAQGTNHINVRVTDRAGNIATTNGAYTVQYDTVVPTASGVPATSAWQPSPMQATGVSMQDSMSGLAASVQYSVGTISGATDRLGWTAMPTQPAASQTSGWSPSWQAAGLGQGINYVNLRISDLAGNTRTVNGAYILCIDSTGPSVSGAPVTTPWTKVNPSLSDVTWNDALSGLGVAQVAVGTTPGATNVLGWTSMPSQPSAGQTSAFTPAWTIPASLEQGSNHVATRIADVAGNVLETSPTYTVRFDSVGDAVSGLVARASPGGASLPASWQTDSTPSFEWQAASGTSPIARYSLKLSQTGANPDGSIEQTALTYTPTALSDGSWTFKVRAIDQAGNLGPIASITILIDRTAPATSISSPSHPVQASFYNNRNATIEWTGLDAASGLTSYWWAMASGSCPSDLAATGTYASPTTTTAIVHNLTAFSRNRFCLRAADALGNAATTSFQFNVDTIAPDITFMTPAFGSRTTVIQDEVRIDYSDLDGGLDPTQLSGVDVDSVQLFIDDVDIIATWGPICTFAPELCRLEVLPDHILFKPIVPFATGNHTLRLAIQDEVLQPNAANVSTHFIVDASNGATGDFDGDQVTDSDEFLVCKLESTENEFDGECNADGTDWLPPRLPGLQEDVDAAAQLVMGVLDP